MTQLRAAWRRAVDTGAGADSGPGLADLLAFLGRDAAASDWTCQGFAAVGPRAAELRQAAASGPTPGARLSELAAGLSRTVAGVFEATHPGDDRPWLALRVADGGPFVVATRNRALLDDLRRQFGEGR